VNADRFFAIDDGPGGTSRQLGIVVSGSLTEGLEVRLASGVSVEDMAVGRYVTIEGKRQCFFGMVTDIRLETTDKQMVGNPPDVSDSFVADVIEGTSTFALLHVLPMLTIPRGAAAQLRNEGPQPVKTIPAHYSRVHEASEEDVSAVFGAEDSSHYFIGTPLDMETKVCLNLERFVERSSGIFGKSGTGKTFLTRILLIGMVQKSKAVSLVFDMHNEYGWKGSWEGHGDGVKGLKQLFGQKVAVFTLDEESSRRRQVQTDHVVEIGYDQIEPEDIEMLKEPLMLSPRAMDAVHALVKHFGERHWLEEFLKLEAKDRDELAEEIDPASGTLRALSMSLSRLKRLPFLTAHARQDCLKAILEYLDRGTNVVLEFGRYQDLTAYVLVANVLTRRLHEHYVERKEKAMGDKAQEPRPLVIAIEEAHKFLNPEVSRQTIFGTIAREMRKYNVTLLVIDQRPSGIDDEIMSQIGTRITCLLDDERDVDSVLMGVSGKNELKSVLAKLETKQQALIFGHAVPMPVVVRTRDYGTAESYREFGFREAAEIHTLVNEDLKLWDR